MRRNRPPSPSRRLHRSASSLGLRSLVVIALILFAVVGCRTVEKPVPLVALPTKHTVRAPNLLLVSDFKLPKDDPVVVDLIDLREQVIETLDLPKPRQDVVVYVFSNEDAYRRYLDSIHPDLPPRRAYFVGTKKELAVYTYWGDRIQEDLRHEFTHGILHASLSHVPLWLDEGLAEYFEVPGPAPGVMNGDYPYQLAAAIANGWKPDIERLEQLEEFTAMRRIDYQESWAWVHYLMHASPDTRQTLLEYLADLEDSTHPTPLAERVAAVQPAFPSRFLGYVASLNSAGGAVIRAASTEL